MSVNRREFVKISAMTSAALLLARQKAWAAFAQTTELQKFIQPLRFFGADIPLASADTTAYSGVDYYQIAMRQFTTSCTETGPDDLRGYANLTTPVSAQKHLEGAIVATVNKPVRVKW